MRNSTLIWVPSPGLTTTSPLPSCVVFNIMVFTQNNFRVQLSCMGMARSQTSTVCATQNRYITYRQIINFNNTSTMSIILILTAKMHYLIRISKF